MDKDTRIKHSRKAMVLRIVFLLLGNLVVLAGIWQQIHFKGVSIASIIFQLQVPMVGADGGNFTSLYVLLGIATPILTALEVWLGCLWRRKTNRLQYLREHIVLPAVVWFVAATVVVLVRMDVFSYFWYVAHPGQLYEENYVDPAEVTVKAPEELRNLVYIYLESMETSYADYPSGGVADRNRIPYMTKLSLTEGESFSGEGKLNGLMPVEGAIWTCGSLVSQTSGLPLIVAIGRNSMGKYDGFLEGAYSLGQMLGRFGYRNIYMQGSKIEFAGHDRFVSSHGNYEVRDYNYYNEHLRLPYKDYGVWWGFEDFRLYEFAKEEISNAVQDGRPFNVTMMTIDTHFTDGYKCPLCGSEFDAQYDNVIRCADSQLEEFITWLQAQDFYENTTVVIVGDHPTMDSRYYSELSKKHKDYRRCAYTVILNGAVSFRGDKTRKYSALDMYPTTLAAMGFEIPGNRLGLGVNLYSDEETLVERMGLEKLNKELLKHSKYYNKHIIEGK